MLGIRAERPAAIAHCCQIQSRLVSYLSDCRGSRTIGGVGFTRHSNRLLLPTPGP